MRRCFWVVVVMGLSMMAWAQNPQPTTRPAPAAAPAPQRPQSAAPAASAPAQQQALPAPAEPAVHPENVPATSAVITIDGACAQPAAANAPSAASCKVMVTRAEFERLVKALEPTMSAAQKQSLADNYVKAAIVSREAAQRGLENDPDVQEVLRFQRMQTLAQLQLRKLQRDAQNVPPAEIEAYYKEHSQQFEEATLHRLYFPKNPPADVKKLSDAELAALADKMQKRAAAGEDFDKIQADAFTQMGIKTPPPPTSLGPERRSFIPQAQQDAIFGLQPGQVTPVIGDNFALYVYKMDSKRLLSLDTVRSDIQRALFEQGFRKALGGFFTHVSAQLNPEYFGPSARVDLPNAQGDMPQRPAAPPK